MLSFGCTVISRGLWYFECWLYCDEERLWYFVCWLYCDKQRAAIGRVLTVLWWAKGCDSSSVDCTVMSRGLRYIDCWLTLMSRGLWYVECWLYFDEQRAVLCRVLTVLWWAERCDMSIVDCTVMSRGLRYVECWLYCDEQRAAICRDLTVLWWAEGCGLSSVDCTVMSRGLW